MFPGCLAEGPFSLRPNERGTALSLSAELSPDGDILSHSIVASHVVPAEKMTYDELDQAVASGSSEKISESLQILLEVMSLTHPLTGLLKDCHTFVLLNAVDALARWCEATFACCMNVYMGWLLPHISQSMSRA